MKTTYLPSFIKDLRVLKSTPVYESIKSLTFETIPTYKSSQEITNIKKLKGQDNAYRLKMGNYRISIFIDMIPSSFLVFYIEKKFIVISPKLIFKNPIFTKEIGFFA